MQNDAVCSPSSKTPKVSVCVVTYNQANYIRQCLQSLVDQKTDFDFEVIVGDDCSTDNTREIVLEFMHRYPQMVIGVLHEKNSGVYKNYASIHSAARGEYIAHMDGDDYALPGKLQAMADAFDVDPCVNIVFHRMRIRSDAFNAERDDLLTPENIRQRRFNRADILAIGAIGCHSAKAYRACTRLKEFPDVFIDFFIDVEQIGKGDAVLLNEVLGVYRAGIGMSSNNKTKNIYSNILRGFLVDYPEHSSEIGGNALTCMLADIKNGRKSWLVFLKLFIDSRSIKSIVIFLKWLPIRKYTRTNIVSGTA